MTSLRTPDLDLMEIQIDALFTHDSQGRMVAIREPGGGPRPRFFLGRTREGNLWRVRHDVQTDIARRLAELAAAEPVGDDLAAPPIGLDVPKISDFSALTSPWRLWVAAAPPCRGFRHCKRSFRDIGSSLGNDNCRTSRADL